MDFILVFPKDNRKNNVFLLFINRSAKMVHLVTFPGSITAAGCARVLSDTIFRLHGPPRELVSNQDT